ncbi:hypothetical protein BFP97_07215 [Roseivirga sp. 4D4]|uniref:hypothetical protein n=1 Tax=Roseivirga sp. 4D4 TaxID=1889784 RepID=UPI000853B9E1|nr:hypothetical protein [Roseivirga sp. 4D4]OEK01316.1 hypothetical protein BFP97_07215 [Roseivirga sp. 4D4]
MRNGALRIPSLMMSFGNDRQSQDSSPFQIQKNNLFMGEKRPVMEIIPMTPAQKNSIDEKINLYRAIENKQFRLTLTLTTLISTALLLWMF